MRRDEFCLSVISLVLNLDAILKSPHVPAEHKQTLAAEFRSLMRRVDESRKAVERLAHTNKGNGGNGKAQEGGDAADGLHA